MSDGAEEIIRGGKGESVLTQSLRCRISCLQLLTVFTKIFLKELNSSEIEIFSF